MACKNPEEYLPIAYIQAVCYRGKARNTNELICTCLARCPLTERFTDIVRSRIMDRRGEGVPVIFSASGKLSGKCPKYELLGDSELKLTIFAAPADDPKALSKIAANLSSGGLHSVNELSPTG